MYLGERFTLNGALISFDVAITKWPIFVPFSSNDALLKPISLKKKRHRWINRDEERRPKRLSRKYGLKIDRVLSPTLPLLALRWCVLRFGPWTCFATCDAGRTDSSKIQHQMFASVRRPHHFLFVSYFSPRRLPPTKIPHCDGVCDPIELSTPPSTTARVV